MPGKEELLAKAEDVADQVSLHIIIYLIVFVN